MATLEFRQVTRNVESQEFDCGIPSINEYVRTSYFPSIAQHAYAYNIVYDNISLGYIQFMFRDIELERFPDDISDIDPGVKESMLSSLHIRFLAIDKRYHGKQLGTTAMNIMIKRVENMAEDWPVRLITIDAREELVAWYAKLGFKTMNINTEGQRGVTVAMYFDCMKSPQKLLDYMADMYE